MNYRTALSITLPALLLLTQCRTPADPSGVDLLRADAGTPTQPKPETDPTGDKPIGPIAGGSENPLDAGTGGVQSVSQPAFQPAP